MRSVGKFVHLLVVVDWKIAQADTPKFDFFWKRAVHSLPYSEARLHARNTEVQRVQVHPLTHNY